MNEFLVDSWNTYVKPQDKGYWLGDVTMGYGNEEKLSWLLHRFNGKLRLNPGNHDNLKSPALHRRFEKIEYWSGTKGWGFFTHHVPLNRENSVVRMLLIKSMGILTISGCLKSITSTSVSKLPITNQFISTRLKRNR